MILVDRRLRLQIWVGYVPAGKADNVATVGVSFKDLVSRTPETGFQQNHHFLLVRLLSDAPMGDAFQVASAQKTPSTPPHPKSG